MEQGAVCKIAKYVRCEYLSLVVMVRIPCLRVLIIDFNLLLQTKMSEDEVDSTQCGAAPVDDDDAPTDYGTALMDDGASPMEEGDSNN